MSVEETAHELVMGALRGDKTAVEEIARRLGRGNVLEGLEAWTELLEVLVDEEGE